MPWSLASQQAHIPPSLLYRSRGACVSGLGLVPGHRAGTWSPGPRTPNDNKGSRQIN